jgi:hypothetical protein
MSASSLSGEDLEKQIEPTEVTDVSPAESTLSAESKTQGNGEGPLDRMESVGSEVFDIASRIPTHASRDTGVIGTLQRNPP